mgnify:CR=1 FL=1
MRLVYICSPLRGDIEQNTRRAQEYCAYAADCGMLPLAPHTIFTHYLDDTQPEQRARGLEMGLELLRHCDEMWVMGNTLSEGMQNEMALAERKHIPCLYVPDEFVESGYKIRQENQPLSSKDCFPNSKELDYKNQILVLKSDAYGTDTAITADDSLWIALSGDGCAYGTQGQSIFAEHLLSGRHAQWKRSDFYGIVDPDCLYCWVADKPVNNNRARELLKLWLEVRDELYKSVEKEMEMEL